MNNKPIPTDIAKYFWGDDITQLSIDRNQKYIIQTLLDRGDSNALKWLFENFDSQEIKHYLPLLKLSKKSANFWGIYLS